MAKLKENQLEMNMIQTVEQKQFKKKKMTKKLKLSIVKKIIYLF